MATDRQSSRHAEQQRRQVALGGGRVVPYPEPTDAAASATGRANPRSDTKPEVALRSALHRHGLRFRKDYPIRTGGGRPIRADIAFMKVRLAVFVDGCFWHGCPEHGVTPIANADYWVPKLARNAERDRESANRLREAGWEVLRIWEHVPTPDAVALVVQALYRARVRGQRSER